MLDSLTPQTVRELLSYDTESGRLFWKHRGLHFFCDERTMRCWNGRYACKEALTCIGSHGYRSGRIFDRGVLAHRVAWAIFYGEWPTRKIDHKDRNPLNNSISNLRMATDRQNACNRGPRGGASPFIGVFWDKRSQKWLSRIRTGLTRNAKQLGHFETDIEAARAYDGAAIVHHGDFAVLNFPAEVGNA